MPSCDMWQFCQRPVTHMDNKGFVYCTKHGLDRRASGVPCRKLRPFELNRLAKGEPIKRY